MTDRRKRAALPPFLTAAATLPGLLVTILINKRISNLSHGEILHRSPSLTLRHNWTPRALERMARTTHFVALLIGRFSQRGQNVYWISDEDELFGNVAKSRDLTDLLAMWSGLYVPHALGEIGAGTTSMDPGDRFEEDVVAIPDLFAGALREFLIRGRTVWGDHVPSGLAFQEPQGLSDKSQLVLSWLATESSLDSVTLLFEQHPDGRYGLSRFDFIKSESALLRIAP